MFFFFFTFCRVIGCTLDYDNAVSIEDIRFCRSIDDIWNISSMGYPYCRGFIIDGRAFSVLTYFTFTLVTKWNGTVSLMWGFGRVCVHVCQFFSTYGPKICINLAFSLKFYWNHKWRFLQTVATVLHYTYCKRQTTSKFNNAFWLVRNTVNTI